MANRAPRLRRMRLVKALLPVTLMVAGPALAQPSPVATGDSQVDLLIDNIARGNRDAAIAAIVEMAGAFGPNAVQTPAELVDKLRSCRAVSSRSALPHSPLFYVTWRCSDGDYLSIFYRDQARPGISVVQFVTAATWADYQRLPVPVPPPVPPR